MLITNTPSDELHIYNNAGKEIVKIDETGVATPELIDYTNYNFELTQEQVYAVWGGDNVTDIPINGLPTSDEFEAGKIPMCLIGYCPDIEMTVVAPFYSKWGQYIYYGGLFTLNSIEYRYLIVDNFTCDEDGNWTCRVRSNHVAGGEAEE